MTNRQEIDRDVKKGYICRESRREKVIGNSFAGERSFKNFLSKMISNITNFVYLVLATFYLRLAFGRLQYLLFHPRLQMDLPEKVNTVHELHMAKN